MALETNRDPIADEEAEAIREALDDSDEIDARRIGVEPVPGGARLNGWIPTPEQATVAVMLAEEAAPGLIIENRLAVDRDMETLPTDPTPIEPDVPAEGELLIGSTDMLSGADTDITSQDQLARGEPWVPPDHPHGVSVGASQPESDFDGGLVFEDGPAAPDLTAADLAAAGRGTPAPGLDPDRAPAPKRPSAPASPVDDLGRAPDDEALEPMVSQVPGTAKGPGAVAESALEGGGTGSQPATETGSINADTAAADPSRYASGNVAENTGVHRGPPSTDDPAIREDLPEAD